MRVPRKAPWDYKLWIITFLTTITLAGGGYTIKTLAADVEGVRERATALASRQEVDDERYKKIQEDMAEIKASIKDMRDVFLKVYMKDERPLPKK